MPIDTHDKWTSRKRIAWLNHAPPEDAKTAFEERDFQVGASTAQELQDPAILAGLAAVVFTQDGTKLLRIRQELLDSALRLLDYDCRIVIQSYEKAELNGRKFIIDVIGELGFWTLGLTSSESKVWQSWLPREEGLPPLPYATIYPNVVPWRAVANAILEHPPGPAPNFDLIIRGLDGDESLSPARVLLLRRAFWNCARIHLSSMDDGRSGAKVFRAYAQRANVMERQWPLPFFVKFDKRKKTIVEYRNYEEYVDPFIPFHLGPHLIYERCCLGAHDGVIVGDYVEGSESLVGCANNGRAVAPIACLFDRTLDGWYRGARVNQTCQIGQQMLARFPRKMSARRMERARELGATKNLEQLRALFTSCNSTPVLVGPIHGDLHARNVRVRATDAIVIDFFRHECGPLVWDTACLEASLLVEGFTGMVEEKWRHARYQEFIGIDDACLTPSQIQAMDTGTQDWLRSIQTLYDQVPLQCEVRPPAPWNPACWFHVCVRQIRLYARQMELGEHQYAASLALALLNKAIKDPKAGEPEASRRAAAYVLAERVLVNTFGSKLGVSDK